MDSNVFYLGVILLCNAYALGVCAVFLIDSKWFHSLRLTTAAKKQVKRRNTRAQ